MSKILIFFHKNADISKIMRVLVLKGNYIQVLDRESRSGFPHPISPTHTSKRIPKKPTQIRVKKLYSFKQCVSFMVDIWQRQVSELLCLEGSCPHFSALSPPFRIATLCSMRNLSHQYPLTFNNHTPSTTYMYIASY